MNMTPDKPICAILKKTEICTWHAQIGTHHKVLNLSLSLSFRFSIKDTFNSSDELDCPGTSGHLGDWFPFLGQLATISL